MDLTGVQAAVQAAVDQLRAAGKRTSARAVRDIAGFRMEVILPILRDILKAEPPEENGLHDWRTDPRVTELQARDAELEAERASVEAALRDAERRRDEAPPCSAGSSEPCWRSASPEHVPSYVRCRTRRAKPPVRNSGRNLYSAIVRWPPKPSSACSPIGSGSSPSTSSHENIGATSEPPMSWSRRSRPSGCARPQPNGSRKSTPLPRSSGKCSTSRRPPSDA